MSVDEATIEKTAQRAPQVAMAKKAAALKAANSQTRNGRVSRRPVSGPPRKPTHHTHSQHRPSNTDGDEGDDSESSTDIEKTAQRAAEHALKLILADQAPPFVEIQPKHAASRRLYRAFREEYLEIARHKDDGSGP